MPCVKLVRSVTLCVVLSAAPVLPTLDKRASRVADARAKEHGLLLRKWRSEKGLNRPEAITQLHRIGVDVSYTYLAKLESGERALASASVEIREGLRHIYDKSRDEWAQGTGLFVPPPADDVEPIDTELSGKKKVIPVYDLLSAGPGGDGGALIEPVEIPEAWSGPHAGYKITGDSMLPDIKPGSTVIVKVQDYASPGNIVVAYTPDRGMLVKFLDRILDDGTHVLVSTNPAYPPVWSKEVRIYGIVREVRNPVPIINGNHGPN